MEKNLIAQTKYFKAYLVDVGLARLEFENGSGANDLVCCDDGYWVYWPEANTGALCSHTLREIFHILEDLNKDWDKQVNDYFDKVQSETQHGQSDESSAETF